MPLLCKEISEQALKITRVVFKLESEVRFNALVRLYPEFSKPYYYLAYFAITAWRFKYLKLF